MGKKENIYPEQFFNIKNPSTPVVEIQFRSKLSEGNSDITNPDLWKSITFEPSSFFESINLEDKGGGQKLELELYDKNFSYLENTIIKSLMAVRLDNKLAEEIEGDSDRAFQFYIRKNSSVNVRIRFGYPKNASLSDDYINTSVASDDDWNNRKGEKTVLKTPWLYFMTTGCKMKYTESGLRASLSCFSISRKFLEKVKLLKKYALFHGEPKTMLDNIAEEVNLIASNNNEEYVFNYEDEPEAYETEEGKKEIEISLGGKGNVPKRHPETGEFTYDKDFKSLKKVLDDICSRIKPKIYDKKGEEIKLSSKPSEEEKEDLNIGRICKYTYSIEESENESGKSKYVINFYYKDPIEHGPDKIRTYNWGGKTNSIISSLDVNANTDYAVMNLSVLNVSRSSGDVVISTATSSKINEDSSEEEVYDASLSKAKSKLNKNLFNSEKNALLVSDIYEDEISENEGNSIDVSKRMIRNLMENVNQQVFAGSLEIPGDPFYLFSGKNVKPFMYYIYIDVKRPSYYDEDGNYIKGKTSYLAGRYAVKSIKHNISTSGFKTTLDIEKWPE